MGSSLTLAARIAAKYAANQRSYRFDKAEVRDLLDNYNDPEVIEESQINLGGYTKATFELVPLSRIKPEKRWNEQRGARLREAFSQNKILPPVRLERRGSRYEIEDGIMRTRLSMENGYTLIPAIVTEWVDTPEAMQDLDF